MQARSLREDLLAIEGVDHAEVDGDQSSPSGLRIRVAEGADQRLVGESIRRVLSDHGLGTDTRLPGEPSTTSTTTTDAGSMASVSELASQSSAPAAAGVATLVSVTDGGQTTDESYEPLVRPKSGEPVEPVTLPDGPQTRATIDRVSVEEGRSGIVITVASSDGQTETELARATDGGVEQAVVLAAARLASPNSPDPIVIEIEERRIEGVDIVMIVLDSNGVVKAGSAVVGAGQAYALGRATWAAILN